MGMSIRILPADTWAEHLAAARDDLRHPLLQLSLVTHRRAVGELGLRLDAVALLAAYDLRCGALRLTGGVLLGLQPFAPLRVRPAEHGELAVVQLGGVVHELEQRHVVADTTTSAPRQARTSSYRRARASRSRLLVGSSSSVTRRAAQPDAGDRGQHRLAAGQLADAPVRASGSQSGLGSAASRARLDVPVVADRVEVLLVGVAGLDRAQRRERRVRCRAARRRGAVTSSVSRCGR